ncbi:uncharacterized protein LOC142609013 [Castanea sativa]|uniref:uncharacterized protein LOC142609013 n=1 Tax=Castanea sativa TaxID=21020 RepID=UPI003F653AF1
MVMHLVWSEREEFLPLLNWCGDSSYGVEMFFFESQSVDAITNVKQQCSDFVMTRNIQCREMTEDVQRQMAGLNFQDNKNASAYNNYPSVGHKNQRSNSQQQADPRPQAPSYQPPEQPTMPGYGPPQADYSSPQVPSPYHVPPASVPYPHPQAQQQQSHASHEYGQPAYPGWRDPYYNAHAQQSGSHPRPPYTIPAPYPPPYQSGYYKQQ